MSIKIKPPMSFRRSAIFYTFCDEMRVLLCEKDGIDPMSTSQRDCYVAWTC